MWPSPWAGDPRPAGGLPSSPVSAGRIGASSQAFAWDDTPITTGPDAFYDGGRREYPEITTVRHQ